MTYYTADEIAAHIDRHGKTSRMVAVFHMLLLANRNRIVTFERIEDTLKQTNGITPTKLSLRTMVSRLRKRLPPHQTLHSHYDLGYELVDVAPKQVSGVDLPASDTVKIEFRGYV